ncbi:MAG TPA: EamA family transporter, partial [Steroidobacteraceae bacterium]|nr:EamA family transporter [Steroidobacteraceae bacterium]
MKSAGAARASIVTYINPAVAALLGVALLNERLGIGGTAGFGLILRGSWLATRRSEPAPRIAGADAPC